MVKLQVSLRSKTILGERKAIRIRNVTKIRPVFSVWKATAKK